jgi:type IV pilus assembly protein PilE
MNGEQHATNGGSAPLTLSQTPATLCNMSRIASPPTSPLGQAGSRPAAGFTLIEVLIVVVIVGILAAIALPSFIDSIRDSRRADAFAALTHLQIAQERFRGNRPQFAASITAAPTDYPPGLGLPAAAATSPRGHYTLAIDAASASGYTITATAVPGGTQAGDAGCQRLRIRVERGNIFHESAGLTGGFDEADANRCWRR